MRRRSIITPGT